MQIFNFLKTRWPDIKLGLGAVFYFAFSGLLISTALPPYAVIADTFVLEDPPASIAASTAPGDPIARDLIKITDSIPGYSDMVPQPERERIFVGAYDGWIWRVDLKTGQAEQFVDMPLYPGGMRRDPFGSDRLYFCASRLYGQPATDEEKVGVYELDIPTKTIRPLIDRVPLPPSAVAPVPGNIGHVFGIQSAPGISRSGLNATNSRPLAYCNDLAISPDGSRIYISESLDNEPTGFGGPYAFLNFVTLGQRGRLWRWNRQTDRVSLAAQGYTFVDGILVDDDDRGQESSVIITENPRSRVLRLHLAGARAGRDEILIEHLPGLTDGLSRDAAGNIWNAQVGPRSGALALVYRVPVLKYLFAHVPPALAAGGSAESGILQLTPDGRGALYFTMHDGSRIRGITKVKPTAKGLYLSVTNPEYQGLFMLPAQK